MSTPFSRLWITFTVFVLFLNACSRPAAILPSPTMTLAALTLTFTPQSTNTPLPTNTPEPILTPTPVVLFMAEPVYENSVLHHFTTSSHFVVLTIDDGYSDESLNKILTALEERHGHATFFLVGNAVSDSLKPETLQRLIDDGNEIGYHSMRHPAPEVIHSMTQADWDIDYSEWQSALRTKLGEELFKKGVTRFVRAPYGDWSDPFMAFCQENQLIPVNWTANEFTFEPGRMPIRNGGILLLHTIPDHLPVLKQLIATDWAIIKLSEVLPIN